MIEIRSPPSLENRSARRCYKKMKTALNILLLAAFVALTPYALSVSAMAQETVTAEDQAPQADAVTLADILKRLAAAGFSEKADLANQLAASGHERSALILTALVDGNLLTNASGAVLIGPSRNQKAYSDPLSGAAIQVDNASALDKITVNNRLRRELRKLAARLSLESPALHIRRDAAENMFTARDAESLPLIEQAITRESDAKTRNRLEQARAAILLQDASSTDQIKLDAIALLRDRGDSDAKSVLMEIRDGDTPAVTTAAQDAIKSIETALYYWSGAQNITYGLSLGSVLLLASIGLAITFGVMGVINMAHGEMIMIGAYTTFIVQQIIAQTAPGLFEYSLLISIPAAFLMAGLCGVAIERGIIRFLYGRPLETLLATWGISLFLQQAVRSIFGPTNREVTAPGWMSGSFDIGLMSVTYSRLWVFIFALLVLAILMAVLRYTQFGMQMRAVTQNRRMASAVGIRTEWVDAMTFGLGCGIAGIAGVALSQIDNVSPNLGQSYIIDSFMVVVFGGVGNLWGTLVGAMSLGIANKFLEPYAGAVLGKIIVLVCIILFMQRRPRGLFALKGRAVEA